MSVSHKNFSFIAVVSEKLKKTFFSSLFSSPNIAFFSAIHCLTLNTHVRKHIFFSPFYTLAIQGFSYKNFHLKGRKKVQRFFFISVKLEDTNIKFQLSIVTLSSFRMKIHTEKVEKNHTKLTTKDDNFIQLPFLWCFFYSFGFH